MTPPYPKPQAAGKTMTLNRRIFCGAALTAAAGAFAQVASMGDAINKAGRQRMLSQRMGKAWLSLGQGIQTESARRVLDQSMACLLYTSPSPRDGLLSRMPSSA